jgi:DNA-binding HxlR family transcriptional regulator
MDWRDVPREPCPVGSALELFGDRWSILIVRDVMNGVRRFDELVDRLGVSRATLSDRLGRLVEAGLIELSDYTDSRGRVRAEYRMTAKGWDLRFVLIALREWGDRHVIGAGREPLRLVDRESGRDVRLALVDVDSDTVVDPRHVQLTPGPGFRSKAAASSVEAGEP